MRDNINLYTYVANSPVKYVDRMGLEKTLIIGFLGRSWSSGEVGKDAYGESGIGQIINGLSNKNTTSRLYYTNTLSPSSGLKDAFQYIKDNKDSYNKIVLLGHSMGADNAVELTQLLDSEQISVDLLITLDLVSLDRTTEIMDNVKIAKNYYQNNIDVALRGSQLELANGNTTTNLSNTEAKYYSDFYEIDPTVNLGLEDPSLWHMDFWHTDIDQLLAPYIVATSQNNF